MTADLLDPEGPAQRCAAHPSRLSAGSCPTCTRSRCAADATARPQGCALCEGKGPVVLTREQRRSRDWVLLLRAALAANGAAVAMGFVVAQYVQADVFEYLAPLVLGLLCGYAATAAAGNPRQGTLARRVRLVCAVYALLGTAFGFLLEGTFPALSSSADVLPPYAVAVLGAWLYATPPKKRKATSVKKARPVG